MLSGSSLCVYVCVCATLLFVASSLRCTSDALHHRGGSRCVDSPQRRIGRQKKKTESQRRTQRERVSDHHDNGWQDSQKWMQDTHAQTRKRGRGRPIVVVVLLPCPSFSMFGGCFYERQRQRPWRHATGNTIDERRLHTSKQREKDGCSWTQTEQGEER